MRQNSYSNARTALRNAENARNQWLEGTISDRECREALLSTDFSLLATEGLSEQFDLISQVNCAIEWLEDSCIGGDSLEVVRRYAMESWTLRQDGICESDPFNLLPPII